MGLLKNTFRQNHFGPERGVTQAAGFKKHTWLWSQFKIHVLVRNKISNILIYSTEYYFPQRFTTFLSYCVSIQTFCLLCKTLQIHLWATAVPVCASCSQHDSVLDIYLLYYNPPQTQMKNSLSLQFYYYYYFFNQLNTSTWLKCKCTELLSEWQTRCCCALIYFWTMKWHRGVTQRVASIIKHRTVSSLRLI